MKANPLGLKPYIVTVIYRDKFDREEWWELDRYTLLIVLDCLGIYKTSLKGGG